MAAEAKAISSVARTYSMGGFEFQGGDLELVLESV